MNRYNYKTNQEDKLENNVGKILRDETLVDLEDVNKEVRKVYNTKIGETLVDREKIEYCGSRRDSYKELGRSAGVS